METTIERIENDEASDYHFETTPKNIRIDERNKTIEDVKSALKARGFEFEVDYNGKIINEELERLKIDLKG